MPSNTRKLPVLNAFVHAVKSALGNMPFAFRLSWPWMLILFPMRAAFSIYVNMTYPNIDPMDLGSVEAAKISALNFPISIVSLIAFASIAVSWHRYILLDEEPQPAQRLRMDKTVWSYVGNVVLIAILAGLCMLVPVFVAAVASAMLRLSNGMAIVLMLIAAVFIVPLFFQLSIKLPAVAIGRLDFGLKEAINASTGNYWPIFGFFVLTLALSLAATLAMLVVSAPFAYMQNAVTFILVVAIQFAANWVMMIFSITMLTSLYGFFAERRDFPLIQKSS